MPLSRRHLLRDGALAVPLHGLATTGGLALAGTRPSDVDDLFARLDRQIEVLREPTRSARFKRYFDAKGIPDSTMHTMLSGLLTTGLMRDLPSEVQREASVQRRIQRDLVGIGEACLHLRHLMAQTTTEERRQLADTMASPEFLQQFWADSDPWFGPGGIPEERRQQLKDGLAKVRWQMTHGDPDAEMDRYVGQVDRALRASLRQIDREDRNPQASLHLDIDYGAELAAPDLTAAIVHNMENCQDVLDGLATPKSRYPDNGAYWQAQLKLVEKGEDLCADAPIEQYEEWRAYKMRRAGRATAVTGGVLFGIGLATTPFIFGFCILTPALILVLVGLALMSAGPA